MFVLTLLLGGPLLEEQGWRGFALPQLQEKYGPLGGTLLLGILWAAWHYPQYLLPEWAAQNGGLNFASVTIFTLCVLVMNIILTWVFNHTRSSLLLVILLHSSLDTFQGEIARMFPAQARTEWNALIGFGIIALLIILLTRGRLGYHPTINRAAIDGSVPCRPETGPPLAKPVIE
jgi:membrane protease YdiL (CAAX protease family)